MAHFAKLDEQNNVLEVNCVHNNELLVDGVENEQKGIDFLVNWSGGYLFWKQTSYNQTFRKNFAASGYTYDPTRDAFIPPQTYASWTLNETTCLWEAPVPRPQNTQNPWMWNEAIVNWVELS